MLCVFMGKIYLTYLYPIGFGRGKWRDVFVCPDHEKVEILVFLSPLWKRVFEYTVMYSIFPLVNDDNDVKELNHFGNNNLGGWFCHLNVIYG